MSPRPGREHPGVGVGAVVVHHGRLLMVERAGAHGAGTWSVPGGWVEMWEHPRQAAEREVREETSVEVLAEEALGWTDSQHRADGVHAVTLWVRCSLVEGVPHVTEPDKCPQVEWVWLEDVGELDLFEPLRWWWPSFLLTEVGA